MPLGAQDPNARQVLARIGTAPSPATSGTDFHVDATVDYFQNAFEQAVPFKIAVYPVNELPTKTNSEIVLVTAYSAGTRTGGAVVQEVQPGHTAPGSVNIYSWQPGDSSIPQSEIQVMVVDATAGTFTLTFNGYTTTALNWNDSAPTIQTALQALSSIGSGNVAVTAGLPNIPGRLLLSDGASRMLLTDGTSFLDLAGLAAAFTVTFQGALANTDEPLITATSSLTTGGPGAVTVTETVAGSVSANEVQTVTIGDSAADGTFTLTFGGQTTNPIVFNTTADPLATELQALSSIGSGNVAVEGGQGGPFTVTFQGTLGFARQPLIVADATLVSNGGLSATQTVGIDATAGTFKLSADSVNYTAALAYNASAATVQSALQGLAAVGAGNCSVTYDAVSGIYTVTWTGALSNSPQPLLAADASSLTLATYHVTACNRAQDNTNARAIVVGDMVEMTTLTDRASIATPLTASGLSPSITPDCTQGEWQVWNCNLSHFGATLTVNAPINPPPSYRSIRLTVGLFTNPASIAFTVTWDPIYKSAGFTLPSSNAAGSATHAATFQWDGLAWICIGVMTGYSGGNH